MSPRSQSGRSPRLKRTISRSIRQKERLARFPRWANRVFGVAEQYSSPVRSLETEKLITLSREPTPSRSSSRMKLG